MGIFVNEGHVMTSTIQPAKSSCSSEVIVHATQVIKVTSIHTDTWLGLGSNEKEEKRKKRKVISYQNIQNITSNMPEAHATEAQYSESLTCTTQRYNVP
jgi:hypothetical protein